MLYAMCTFVRAESESASQNIWPFSTLGWTQTCSKGNTQHCMEPANVRHALIWRKPPSATARMMSWASLPEKHNRALCFRLCGVQQPWASVSWHKTAAADI